MPGNLCSTTTYCNCTYRLVKWGAITFTRQKPALGTGEHVHCIDERCEVAEQMARFGGTARQGPNTGLCHTLGCVRFPITDCEIVILSFRKEGVPSSSNYGFLATCTCYHKKKWLITSISYREARFKIYSVCVMCGTFVTGYFTHWLTFR